MMLGNSEDCPVTCIVPPYTLPLVLVRHSKPIDTPTQTAIIMLVYMIQRLSLQRLGRSRKPKQPAVDHVTASTGDFGWPWMVELKRNDEAAQSWWRRRPNQNRTPSRLRATWLMDGLCYQPQPPRPSVGSDQDKEGPSLAGAAKASAALLCLKRSHCFAPSHTRANTALAARANQR
jgi:hypothetical protein